MTSGEKVLLGSVLILNGIGAVLGVIGIQAVRAWRFGPFQTHDSMFTIMLPFHPIPPDWIFVPWAYAPIGVVAACLVLPVALPGFLLSRRQHVQAWALCLLLTTILAGSGIWVWLHAHFNVSITG